MLTFDTRKPLRLIMIPVVLLVVSCDVRHFVYHMQFSGMEANGLDNYKTGSPNYSLIRWNAPYEWDKIPNNESPSFSVQLPDGSILTPEEMTLEEVDARGAKDYYSSSPSQSNNRVFNYPNGWELRITFNGIGPRADRFLNNREQMPDGALVEVVVGNISFAASEGKLGTGIAIGDRNGKKMVTLPASEVMLQEVFGEPISKRRFKPASKNEFF